MNILIDATGVPTQKAGVGVYARNLLDQLTNDQLTHQTPPLRLFLLIQDDDPDLDFSARPNVTILRVPARFFRILPLRFLLEQLYLPFLLLRHRIHVVHSLHYAFPLLAFGTRRVVTFHDMTFYNMPEVHQRIKVIYFRFFMRASVRLADRIIFISRSALNDCTARLGPIHGIATVIPHGKSPDFHPDIPAAQIAQVRQTYSIPGPFILYIGTIEPRKNLTRLVEAFAPVAAREPEIQLVLAGKMGWMSDSLLETIARLSLTHRVLFTGFIHESDKPALLAACTVFVYPSLYEGFGLPALEALAAGAPTITSNTSSLPEVVGPAALLIDPTDTAALTQTLADLLASPTRQQHLRQAGPLQAAHFTWDRTAAQTAEVYRSCR